jgi:MFS transporter, ACS family, tartrate transporter
MLKGGFMSEQQIFAKCAWRLIPFMMLLYFTNILDRSNVGFAVLTMNSDLGFSPSTYGFGVGLFFVGYSLFVIPATVAVARVGARRAVFCIMSAWGLLSAANAFAPAILNGYLPRFRPRFAFRFREAALI